MAFVARLGVASPQAKQHRARIRYSLDDGRTAGVVPSAELAVKKHSAQKAEE